MDTTPNPIDSTWWIIDNPSIPGELITLTAGEIKYALVFSNPELALKFLRVMNDSSLTIASLETWVLKDAFLTAGKILGATRIMFDYSQGLQSAQNAPLERVAEYLKTKIGT